MLRRWASPRPKVRRATASALPARSKPSSPCSRSSAECCRRRSTTRSRIRSAISTTSPTMRAKPPSPSGSRTRSASAGTTRAWSCVATQSERDQLGKPPGFPRPLPPVRFADDRYAMGDLRLLRHADRLERRHSTGARAGFRREARGRNVHVAASAFHDILPANELGLRSVWINRLDEVAEPRPTRELEDLELLADTLDELVPA